MVIIYSLLLCFFFWGGGCSSNKVLRRTPEFVPERFPLINILLIRPSYYPKDLQKGTPTKPQGATLRVQSTTPRGGGWVRERGYLHYLGGTCPQQERDRLDAHSAGATPGLRVDDFVGLGFRVRGLGFRV